MHNNENLENLEKINFGLGGIGSLMQAVDYNGIEHLALRRVGLLIESVTDELDEKIRKIRMEV